MPPASPSHPAAGTEAVKDYGVLGWSGRQSGCTPRQAEAGQRMLAWLARPLADHGASLCGRGHGRLGGHDHRSPVTGRHRLVSAELDLSAAALRAPWTFRGSVPQIGRRV
jgi:hypothetical protein